MINKNCIKIFVAYILFLISCDAEVDQSGDLGGGYVFSADGGKTWIRGANVYEDGIPGNIKDYGYNSEFIIATQKPSRKYLQDNFSDDITARYSYLLYNTSLVESPDEYQKRFMNSKWWLDTALKSKISKHISPDNHNNTDEISRIVDSVVNHDPTFKKMFSSDMNYWIIVKQGNLVYGPLSKMEYLQKRKELSLPDELEF